MNLGKETLFAFLIIIVIFAISEVISLKSKGLISILLTSSILFIVAYMLGLNQNVFEISGINKLGNLAVSFFIVHLGSSIKYSELLKQWKAIVIAVAAEVGIILFIFVFGFPFDHHYKISSISPIGGGVIATLLIQSAAENLGNLNMIVYSTLLLSITGFLGYILISFLLKKEAMRLLTNSDLLVSKKSPTNHQNKFVQNKLKSFIEKYNTPPIILAKVALVACLGYFASELTLSIVNPFITCLVLGFIFKEIGFFDEHVFIKSNSYGIFMIALISIFLSGLKNFNLTAFFDFILPIIYFLLLGIFGILIFSVFVGKMFKMSFYMSLAIGSACLIGFPGTMVIPQEISETITTNNDERKYLLNHLMQPMIISGVVNVSIISIFIAGFLVNFY